MAIGWEWLGLNALRGVCRRARTGMWDYLTVRAHTRGVVELERERNRGAVDKMGALPPDTTLFESGPDGRLRLELNPRAAQPVTVEMAPVSDADAATTPIEVIEAPAEQMTPPRELPAPPDLTSVLMNGEPA